MKQNYTIEKLLIAFRKAKADIFFENGYDNLAKLAEYEENLLENLAVLCNALNKHDIRWLNSREIIGSYKYILKEIKLTDKVQDDNAGFVYFSNKIDNLDDLKIDSDHGISFRFIGYHSIDFHVISSLWIDEVGINLERHVSENSYGSRLKRINTEPNKFVSDKTHIHNKTKYNSLVGHFRKYYWDYKRWQSNGINKIKDALIQKKSISVLTADIRKFYHSVSPDFLLDPKFYKDLGIKDSEPDHLTSMLVGMLNKWNSTSYETISRDVLPDNATHCGIPVGLSASKVIANLFLIDFDRKIEQEVSPLYYGRYVDDILLVIENNKGFRTARQVWEYIQVRVDTLEYISVDNEPRAQVKIPYANKGNFSFGTNKEKLFVLEGSSGEAFIEAIKENMDENTSEWRLLPDSDNDVDDLSNQITSTNKNSEEIVNNLRKSDGLSIQRLKFALKLRDFETLVGIVPKDVWDEKLVKFLKLCKDVIIVPQQFNAYLPYYPRIVGLAVKANKFEFAADIVETLKICWSSVEDKLSSKEKSIFIKAEEFARELVIEAVKTNISFYEEKLPGGLDLLCGKLQISKIDYIEKSKKLFLADLHTTPFRRIFFDIDIPAANLASKLYRLEDWDGISELVDINLTIDFLEETGKFLNRDLSDRKGIANALFFYTRPFNALELTMLLPKWLQNKDTKHQIDSFFKLFQIPAFKGIAPFTDLRDRSNKDFPNKENPPKYRDISYYTNEDVNPIVALTSLKTDEKSWNSNVRDDNFEPDNTRISRIFDLVNDILKCNTININYVVFPELSLPRELIVIYIAQKLKNKNISLIAGIEYLKKYPLNLGDDIRGTVSNQLIYILNTKTGNYNSQVAIIQEKQIPAYHEETELYRVGGKIMTAESNDKYIIKHNSFFFSGLICNDLLNIENRYPLRGNIDALFVVEWNKDIDMYDAILSSTTNDLHCFMVQVNNRLYGDTRLRGPYKEAHARDIVRVRGGELDYFVVAKIEAKELREFQRDHRSSEKQFKPVPTGFEISTPRRREDLKRNIKKNDIK